MKSQAIRSTAYYACTAPSGHNRPNAATGRYYLEKIVDGFLPAAITLAVVVFAIVLITM